MRYTLLTHSEKILKLRKDLNVSQETLAGKNHEITRGTISQIELGDIPITHNSAEIITKNALEIAKQKGINLYITEDYLLETYEDQIERIATQAIIELSHLTLLKDGVVAFKKAANDFEYFINDYNVSNNSKYKFYQICLEFYKEAYDYTHQNLIIIKAIDLAILCKKYDEALFLMAERSQLYYALGASKKYPKKCFEEMIEIANTAVDFYKHYKIENKHILDNLMFKRALAYQELFQNDLCLKYLSEMYQFDDNLEDEMILKIKTVQANVYCDQKKYDISIKIHEEILKMAKVQRNSEIVGREYRNLTEVYLLVGNRKKALECIEFALDLKDLTNKDQILVIYNYALKLYIDVGKKTYEIINMFTKARRLALETDNKDIFFELYSVIIEYYMQIDNMDQIIKLFKDIQNIVDDRTFINDKLLICLYKITTYLKDKDGNLSDQVLKFALNLEGKIKNDIL